MFVNPFFNISTAGLISPLLIPFCFANSYIFLYTFPCVSADLSYCFGNPIASINPAKFPLSDFNKLSFLSLNKLIWFEVINEFSIKGWILANTELIPKKRQTSSRSYLEEVLAKV